jgi:hypothetical protein
MTTLIIIVCVIVVAGKIIRARMEARILNKNPEAYRELKEAQAKRRQQRRRALGVAALGIARILLRKSPEAQADSPRIEE